VGSVLQPYLLEKLAPLKVGQVVAQVQVKLAQQLVVHDLLDLQVPVGFSHPQLESGQQCVARPL
jgi:hypothetical protein